MKSVTNPALLAIRNYTAAVVIVPLSVTNPALLAIRNVDSHIRFESDSAANPTALVVPNATREHGKLAFRDGRAIVDLAHRF